MSSSPPITTTTIRVQSTAEHCTVWSLHTQHAAPALLVFGWLQILQAGTRVLCKSGGHRVAGADAAELYKHPAANAADADAGPAKKKQKTDQNGAAAGDSEEEGSSSGEDDEDGEGSSEGEADEAEEEEELADDPVDGSNDDNDEDDDAAVRGEWRLVSDHCCCWCCYCC